VIPEFGVFKLGMLEFGRIELDRFELGIVFDKFDPMELIMLGRLTLGRFKFGMIELEFMVDLGGWFMFEMLEFMFELMVFMILEFMLLCMLELGIVAFGIPS